MSFIDQVDPELVDALDFFPAELLKVRHRRRSRFLNRQPPVRSSTNSWKLRRSYFAEQVPVL